MISAIEKRPVVKPLFDKNFRYLDVGDVFFDLAEIELDLCLGFQKRDSLFGRKRLL